MTLVEFGTDLWQQKTRLPGVSCAVVCVILRLAVLVEHRLVTDRQTDGLTDTGRVTRRPAKGGHVLLFEVLSSVRQALALYGKISGFSQSLTCPHCWLEWQWHNIISIVYRDLIVNS